MEKTEINLHNKSKISNITNNNDLTINKSITQNNPKYIPNNGNNLNLKLEMLYNNNKVGELKNLEKIHHSKNSELYRFMTTSVERKSEVLKQKSFSNNKNDKVIIKESINFEKKKTNNYIINDIKPNNQMSFEVNLNNGGLTDLLVNQNKSRNYQSSFGKNNIFNSDKTPTYSSINIKNNNLLKDNLITKTIQPKSNVKFENNDNKTQIINKSASRNPNPITNYISKGLNLNATKTKVLQNISKVKDSTISLNKIKEQNGIAKSKLFLI